MTDNSYSYFSFMIRDFDSQKKVLKDLEFILDHEAIFKDASFIVVGENPSWLEIEIQTKVDLIPQEIMKVLKEYFWDKGNGILYNLSSQNPSIKI